MVLWNPSIRKSVGMPVPSACDVHGFGVCPKTNDPKIVRIAFELNQTNYSMDQYAEVFTLSSGVWRRVLMNSPIISLDFPIGHHVVIGGVIYWVAHEYGQLSINIKGVIRSRIISFDLASEEFGEVDLPDSLAGPNYHLRISKLKESLVVLNYRKRYPGDQRVCDAWMMENGVSKYSFTKLFTFQDNSSNASEVGRMANR
ncbi:F-box protein CPR1-like [Bidens hawaiensis]|uniref:F-box protein CPR1-like n=1 Tax=Bidens hawaiensis TaxID=980011 RepID=UPI004049AF90